MTDKQLTVLVVEDEALLLDAIEKKIQLSGMGVVACSGGAQAFDYLQSSENLPDIIWLDYYLKDTNGLDFMHQLKKNPVWEHIPVLVISNSASHDKVHSLLALGAKKYILKAEYRLDEIINMIREFATK